MKNNFEEQIIKQFEALRYSVRRTAALKNGFPTLAIAKNGCNTFIQVKDGKLPPSGRKLTEDEETFWREWNGSIVLIQSVDEVMAFDKKRLKRFQSGTL